MHTSAIVLKVSELSIQKCCSCPYHELTFIKGLLYYMSVSTFHVCVTKLVCYVPIYSEKVDK